MSFARNLLLEYDQSLLPDGEGQVLRKAQALTKSYWKDPAGKTFHKLALIQSGLLEYEEPESIESDNESEYTCSEQDANDNVIEETLDGTKWKRTSKPKSKTKSFETDYYKLLGLENERWLATEDQISKAYKKVCLKMHPDKFATQSQKERDKAEEKFKEIQEAYQILSNESSRLLYDSTDSFDDSLPVECDPKDFFRVYGPAFKKYSRWSCDKNVPDLGDEDSDWEGVCNFYDFWFAFKSWREFPHPEEEDPASAECREQRRYIEQCNARLRKKAKKEETKRIRDFVESSYRLDPRVISHKEAEKKARLEKQRERAKAREEAEEAERLRQEREAAKAREIEEAEQKQREEEKRVREQQKTELKEQRRRLRDVCTREDCVLLDNEKLSFLCSRLDKDKLSKLSSFLETELPKNLSKCKTVLKNTLDTLEQKEEEARKKVEEEREAARQAAEEAKAREAEKKAALMTEWTEEELKLLDKAMKKFPQGTRRRWDQVSDYIRTRSLEEVLQMVKERKGASSKRFEAQQNWRSFSKRDVDSEPTMADESFTDVQIDRQQPNQDNAAACSASTDWTKDQELALVKAMKAIGKGEADRWDKIALQVEGKSKTECSRKFKELKESFRATKSKN